MTKLGEAVTRVGAVGVSVRGLDAEAHLGRTASARGAGDRDAVDEALGALQLEYAQERGFVVREQLSLEVRPPTSDRSSAPPIDDPDDVPRVRVEAARPTRDELGQVAVVEDDGVVRFVLPDPDGSFDIRVSEDAGELARGGLQQAGSMVVRIVGLVGGRRAARAATRALADRIEGRRRPHRLRRFRPEDVRRPAPRGIDASDIGDGRPALLLIHGLNSSSHNGFGFSPEYVRRLDQRYGGRVFAFDHPSLCASPEDNARWLAEQLRDAALPDLDILAHSRGGLVARAFLLEKPANVDVRSIVFVATPNSGTPLADTEYLGQLLTVVTNLVGLVPDNGFTDAIGIAIDALREFVLEGIGALPGIAALHERSATLARLNAEQPSDVRLRAIAADYSPRSNEPVVRRLRDLAMDRIFLGAPNDLLVPTRSAYERTDQFAIPTSDRLVLAPSVGVHHGTFWTEDRVLDRLDQWLDPAVPLDRARPVEPQDTDPAAELEHAMAAGDIAALREAVAAAAEHRELDILGDLVGGPLPVPSRSVAPTRHRGLVVVLPGIMGSRLAVGDRTIWLQGWQLLRGRFTWLRIGEADERTVGLAGLMRQYAPLLVHLDRSWDVLPFPYDWRRSIDDAAALLDERLAEERDGPPIHFVAHSMGGLVVRALFARDPEVWRQRAGRVVQLGTPNRGSFAMPLAVNGDERLVRALAFADIPNSKDDVVATLASFPGIYDLFPAKDHQLPDGGHDHEALYDAARWRRRDAAAVQRLLDRAEAFHRRLADEGIDERFTYVAGDGHRTPYRARVEADGGLSFGLTTKGDGRVPHDFGHDGLGFADGTVHYVDSSHGDLIGDNGVLAALNDLLLTGRSTMLSSVPAARRGLTGELEEWIPAADVERRAGRADPLAATTRGATPMADRTRDIGIEDATSAYIGSTGAPRPAFPPLRVRVVHGSMEQAKYPVAAGRYKGIPIEGALGYLDDRFSGALTDLHRAGLFADEAGAGRYLRAADHVYPVGAILLGLGDFGSLTPDQLARAVERGASDYALAERRLSGGEPILGISAVLVGTPGRYGLSVPASVAATIRGVARASAGLTGIASIEELEFIELSEHRAEEAAAALERLKDTAELASMDVPIEVDSTVEARAGGRPGSRGYDETGSPWPRLTLQFEDDDARQEDAGYPLPDDRVRTLIYQSMGRRAQASDLRVNVSMAQVDRHVRAAIHSPLVTEQTSNTLFELLLPNDAKLELETFDNLHLLVDETTAFVPWEMITGRESTGQLSQPLAVRAGLLRQLKPRREEAPRKHLRPTGQDVLVIGDPPTGDARLPRLPGAQQEATLVAGMLDDAGYPVTACISGGGDTETATSARGILDAFFSHHYRIIHIAAHGRFDEGTPVDPLRNGVVIGRDDVLGPMQFRQRLVAPDLVFLNCCHVGRIDDPRADAAPERFSHLAASLSIELMRSGVRAVVAAGWAVHDSAARDFARVFYEMMLGGRTFGDAVRAARLEAYHQYPSNNTWAAYQCYGDPDFQFPTAVTSARTPPPILSAQHLIKELQALEKKAGDAVDAAYVDDVLEAIRELEQQHLPRFESKAVEIRLALAKAFAEAGSFDDAVHCYRTAIDADLRGVCALEARWQLANLEARLAAQLQQPARRRPVTGVRPPRVEDSSEQLFEGALRSIEQLALVAPSAELHAIEGSLFKKRAATARRRNQLRRDDLTRSAAAYWRALEVSSQDKPVLNVYHASLALQMEHALHPRSRRPSRRATDTMAALERQLPMYERRTGDYFERAQHADIVATRIIVAAGLGDPAQVATVVEEFTKAFRVRSTRRQRLSVIDNYWDLHHLLRDPAECDGARAVAEALESFTPAHGRARVAVAGPTPRG